MVKPTKPATYQDLVNLPEHLIGEILDGELVVSPRPAMRHAQCSSVLGWQLTGPFRFGQGGPGGWHILFEPELHLGRDVIVPDVGAWRHERLPHVPDQPWIELAPDWCCEVLSPSTQRVDRSRKLSIYAREGVPHVWLIDPTARILEVLLLEGARYLIAAVHDGDIKVRAEPFNAIELDLSLLWGDAPA